MPKVTEAHSAAAKLTAHTVGIYLNLLLSRPLLALKDFDLIQHFG